jgi:lipoyl(octanoyl) transferase
VEGLTCRLLTGVPSLALQACVPSVVPSLTLRPCVSSLALPAPAVSVGPVNMALDEALLHSATERRASLRFYGWSEPTVSLGYFQSHARQSEDSLLRDLPFVRRPTGGDALVHQHELTYCLAVPAGRAWQSGAPWLRMHEVFAAALGDLGVEAVPYRASSEKERFSGFLCFQHFTSGDLLVVGSKVVGSAQRKTRGAVMQHGGILLASSPFTPQLPGIQELTGQKLEWEDLIAAIVRHMAEMTGWQIESEEWTEEESRLAEELVRDRYANEGWNRKR